MHHRPSFSLRRRSDGGKGNGWPRVKGRSPLCRFKGCQLKTWVMDGDGNISSDLKHVKRIAFTAVTKCTLFEKT